MIRVDVIALVATALAASAAFAGERYPIYIQPGLVGNTGPSQVVPSELPFRAGLGRVSATIEEIERIALVTADNLPSVHPSLGRGPTGKQVWVVIFRGRVRSSLPGYFVEDRPITRGFFLVADDSGWWCRMGGIPNDGAP